MGTLFERALEVPREQRAAFVGEACADDAALREDLLSLLEAHESATDYFDGLSADVVAPVLSATGRAAGDPCGTDVAAALQTELAGTYRIERELGGGGMSRVFVAEDLHLKRRVVIKVLPPETALAASAERFQREIELAAQLQHPHIVPLLTADSAGGMLYYTMPFVSGESLGDLLAREGALPFEDALRIWRDILDALAHAHASGVVHRDIKPGNILLSGRHALVTDFGISRALETAAGGAGPMTPGLVIGTPAYMAPEEVMGGSGADQRVDIYSAGLVMYEMLAGRPPFTAGSAREHLVAHRTLEPPPLPGPAAPRKVLELVMRCLAKDPGARPQSVDGMLAELDANASGDGRPNPTGIAAHRLRRVVPYAIMALALSILVLTAIRLGLASPPVADAPVELPGIALLPWTDLGSDPAGAPLADAMTRGLEDILGTTAELRVIASPSASAVQYAPGNVRPFADSLHVAWVLEGSVRKSGSALRVQARLLDARDGSTRWSETWDRGFADVFDVQDDIVRAVAIELAVQLPERNRAGLDTGRHTTNIAAYEWYLRGMDLALLRSDSGRLQGIEDFERAIASDPTYVDAYAGLVRMYVQLSNAAPDATRREWLERARRAALKAVALDSTDADARSALGWVRLMSRDYGAAEAEFKLAIAADPGVPRGHEGLARVYMMTGRPAEQLTEAHLGVQVDPFSHSAIRELALALATNGRCEDSLELLRPLKTLSPPAGVAGILSGLCYASRQMWPEAIADFRWATDNSATAGLAFLGYALARSGRKDEAARVLADLLAGRKYSHGSFGVATVYAGMQDYDQAFAWLDTAADDGTMNFYIMHPLFADLHRDPRFDGLEQRMGVPGK